jgi:hypothetical protein
MCLPPLISAPSQTIIFLMCVHSNFISFLMLICIRNNISPFVIGIDTMDLTDNPSKTTCSDTQPKENDLLEKSKGAPIVLRILMDTIRTRLEKDYPQVMSYPQWSAFDFACTVAGTVALAVRLHYDVVEKQRTPLELSMCEVLRKRFPQSEQAYMDCYKSLNESLMKLPISERDKYPFVLLGYWVVMAVSEGIKVDNEEMILSLISLALQNDTVGYWTEP